MNISLPKDYDTWVVHSIDGQINNYLNVYYIQTTTWEKLHVLFKFSDIHIDDEIEFIRNKKNQTIVSRNITLNKTIKDNNNVLLPHELILHHNNTALDHDMRKLEKYHQKIVNFGWVELVYEKYIYLVQSWSTKWWARNPNNPSNYKSTKLYIENARNIFFFFYAHRAKEVILELYHDNKNFSHALVDNIIREYYYSFLYDLRGLPLELQSFEEFELQLAWIKAEIGL